MQQLDYRKLGDDDLAKEVTLAHRAMTRAYNARDYSTFEILSARWRVVRGEQQDRKRARRRSSRRTIDLLTELPL